MKRALLDSSFVIDLLRESAERRSGPAVAWMRKNGNRQLWITPVTLAEVLEGAADRVRVRQLLGQFKWHGIGRIQAEKVARCQSRASHRLGENDAWQVAVAESIEAIVVGHDPAAFGRLGIGYEDHRALG